ncbi:MAG TPA: hypothetical protein VKU00_20995 [Chthonomonadaceae bacterium]|nr:hypothetical protein [Chthonomonadaceae bacterium]
MRGCNRWGGLLLAGMLLLAAGPNNPCTGETRTPVPIQSVRTTEENGRTILTILLAGQTTPTLNLESTRVTLTLPFTAPGPHLAENLRSGGLVSRLSLQTMSTSETRLIADLKEAAYAEFSPSAPGVVRLKISPFREAAVPSVHKSATGLYDIVASQADVGELLRTLAHEAGVNLVQAGAVKSRVSLELHDATIDRAIDLVTRSAGLTYHRDGDVYVVGAAKDIEAAYPKPQAEPVKPAEKVIIQSVYHCRHVNAAEMLTTLEKIFDKDQLHASVGASGLSPHLDEASTSSVTGVQSGATTNKTTTETSTGAREVVVSGEASVVKRALDLMQMLDRRRQQVRISVHITDISNDALKNLGVQWSWSSYSVTETAASGINFGTFTHAPVNIEAQLAAMENNNQAKMLASPTISLLDGERGYILIGDRLLFPKLIGYTQAQTPIFDKDEERVGIYLQVAAQISDEGEITLTIYPQVSVVTGYLTVSNASYPQISTREQQTTIRVKDGEKIIVGGLIQDQEIKQMQKIPLLSRIPLFGELFTWRNTSHNKSEVVIMITPQILKD